MVSRVILRQRSIAGHQQSVEVVRFQLGWALTMKEVVLRTEGFLRQGVGALILRFRRAHEGETRY